MSGYLWPAFWFLCMLGLVIATTVIALREKKARNEALKKMQPQPIGPGMDPGADPMAADEGFGEPEMGDFGATNENDFAELDENAAR
jgi:hypothetical protein